MTNVIAVIIILAILGAAIAYIVKEKRRGVKCIGCSAAAGCTHHAESAGATCRHEASEGCVCGCQSDTDI